MALYSGRLLMRGGNEADFDPDKMMPREWAVSTDEGIVRICFKPGVCIRMATYEAFEKDMAKIEEILKECQSIQEAVIRINTEVNKNADAVAEYTAQAKTYMESAKVSATNAKTSETNAKTSEVNAKSSETNAKVSEEKAQAVFESLPEDYSTLSKEFYEVAIKQKASGEEIHVTDSANAKVREFALFGKAKQETTSGNQLLDMSNAKGGTHAGITAVVNPNGSYAISGTATSNISNIWLKGGYGANLETLFTLPPDIYYVSGVTLFNGTSYISPSNGDGKFTLTQETNITGVRCKLLVNGTTYNETIYPMLNKGTEPLPWEPYTGSQPSPNPDYPQDVEVSGESYNLLKNTATSQTINGVTFTVNEDKSVTVKGTATAITYFNVGKKDFGNDALNTWDSPTRNGYTISADVVSKSDTYGMAYNWQNKEVNIVVRNGITIDETFYPMIRKASVKNDRYMPFGVDSVEVKSVGKNLFNEIFNGYLMGSNAEGHWIVSHENSCTLIGKVAKNTDYTVKKYSDGNRFRIVLFKDKPTNVSSLNSVQIIRDDSMSECSFNSLDYNYVVLTLNYDNASITTKKAQLEVGTVATEYQPHKETLSKIPTPNGLAGIKVSSGGNYTDSNGQQWICDEIVKYADGSGEKIRRIGKVVLNGTETWELSGTIGKNGFYSNNAIKNGIVKVSPMICDNFVSAINNNADMLYNQIKHGMDSSATRAYLYLKTTVAETVDELKAFLAENNATCYYILAEPIRTPLTAEEIAEIEKLSTFNPVTNISNDADCGMEVTYIADTKLYVDSKIAELATAMVNNI